MEKTLGKIVSANVGIAGYQDAMFGLTIIMESNGWGVSNFISAGWAGNIQANNAKEFADRVSSILTDAKVNTISKLQGVPVEIVCEKGSLVSWRVLKEVL